MSAVVGFGDRGRARERIRDLFLPVADRVEQPHPLVLEDELRAEFQLAYERYLAGVWRPDVLP